MPFGGLLTGGLIAGGLGMGLIGDVIGSNAQQDINEANLNQQNSDRGRAIAYATPTVDELEQQHNNIQYYGQQLQRQQQLLSAIDPTIINAGKQLLDLQNGKNAAAIQPMLTQRNLARQQLMSNLEKQMGPGAAASSTGIQALNQFDTDTASLTAAAQSQAMGQYESYLTSNKPNPALIGQLGEMNLSGMQRQQGMQISALEGTPITNAGAQFTGAANMGNMLSSVGGQLAKGGMTAGTLSMLKGSGMGPSNLSETEMSDLQGNIGQLSAMNNAYNSTPNLQSNVNVP